MNQKPNNPTDAGPGARTGARPDDYIKNFNKYHPTPRPRPRRAPKCGDDAGAGSLCGCCVDRKGTIDESIMKEVIDSVLNGTPADQKITIYSPRAAKILITAEEYFPQAGKCSVAGYLVENYFPCSGYGYVWERVMKDIPETNRYGSENIAQVVESIKMGEEFEERLKDTEERIEKKEASPYITIHSPRLVAALKYIERTVPKFKKGTFVASMLSKQAMVNFGETMCLEMFF